MKNRAITTILGLLVAIVAVGCSDSAGPAEGNGIVRLVMTDAPFPIGMVSEANVSITRVEMRAKGSDNDSAFRLLTDVDTVLNLIDLQNGVTASLGEIEIPEGEYDEIRLITGDAEIILTDARSFDLKVPSGDQTGIKVKIKPGITVEDGQTTEVLLDFDLSKSFVVKGNPDKVEGITGFNFKPVIRAVASAETGRVNGQVLNGADNTPIANAYVVLTEEGSGTEVYEGYTDATGFYALIGIPVGTYKLEVSADGYKDEKQSGLTVEAGKGTTADVTMTVK